MSKSCIVVNIQNNFRIVGFRIKTGGSGKYLIEKNFAGTFSESDGPGEMLQQAMAALNAQSSSRIVLVDQIKRSSVFEMHMPILSHEEIKHAIEFELVKHTPLPASEIVWGARTVPRISDKDDEASKDDSNNALQRVRVCFMERSSWIKFLSELQVRQINIDVYLNPFMTVDPFAAGNNIFLPMIDDHHVFTAGENGLRQMVNVIAKVDVNDFQSELVGNFEWQDSTEVKTDEFIPCMLAARYVLSGEYDNYEKKLALKLPASLLPKRNKLLKYFTVVNAVAALICLLLLLYQMRQEVYRIYVEQKNAISLVQTQITNLQKLNAVNKKDEKLRQKIIDAVPQEIDPLKILASMARKLPKYIWIRSYNMTTKKVHLSLTSSRDPGNLLSTLRDDKNYTIDNLRKSRRYDGTYYLYLMLAPPKTMEGGK